MWPRYGHVMQERNELVDGALDYVLEHGLLGLSLRPLATALGTSNRMLIYYFGSKEQLVDAVLAQAQDRLGASVSATAAAPSSVPDLVRQLWAALGHPHAAQVARLYLEICLMAAQDPLRWRHAPARLREPWRDPLRVGLTALGAPTTQVDALADLILDTLDGLSLDRLTSDDNCRVDAAAEAFATLLAHVTEPAAQHA